MQSHEFRDAIFKGCTRPALVFGVPVIPLFVVGMAVAILSQLTNMFVLLLLVPIVLVMAAITRSDDQQYRLLWLRFYCRVVNLNSNAAFWQSSTYAPNRYRKTR
jgi:type IV secretion system protein VirB3